MKKSIFEKLGQDYENAIAVIGRNGRFPGANTVEELWSNLVKGIESVSLFSKEELSSHLQEDAGSITGDGLLDNIDLFDADFFDYSAREAQVMDPQHRIFLECAWEMMEQAGYVDEELAGKVAVYGGSNLSSYMIRNLYSNPGLVDKLGSFKTMIANSQDFVATKVSYKMNFTGASMNVNTLCSSALVATQMACQSLRNYESDVALAGAANIQVSRDESFFYQEGGIGSADGHCRAFDEKASGTVSGSGVAMVLLKRLEDAIEDGDTIHAVIRGAAINNDGSVKNSYTAPNADGQAECIAEAIEDAGINPETITNIEAHGTGTNLGDPIEIAGLTQAFRAYTDNKQYCAIGSLKTNIGHLVNAGGVASLIKVVESLKHKQIPASLNFDKPNPKIDFENSPFFVNTELRDWERLNGEPLRAGVSSFGIGGTNAHIIVEEAPEIEPSGASREYNMITLSAKTSTALENMTENLEKYIKNKSEINLADIAYTLHVGRLDFNYKRSIVAKNLNELKEKLELKNYSDKYQKEKEQSLIFILPKFSNELIKLDKEIYENEFVYKDKKDECLEYLEKEHNMKLEDLSDSLNEYLISYSLSSLLLEWGILPEQILGDGLGEYVAATISELISKEDAMDLIIYSDDEIENKFEDIEFNDNEILYYSNINGDLIEKDEIENAEYWLNYKEKAVNFKKSLETALELEDRIIVDLSFEDHIKDSNNEWIKFFNIENGSYSKALLEGLSKLWLLGCKINWAEYYSDEFRHRIILPTYPFEKKSYWIEPGKKEADKNDEERNRLSATPRPEIDTVYIEPRNEVENLIAKSWSNTLGLEKIGVNDNFFELGGDSLHTAAVATQLKKEFDVEIPMTKLLEKPTVSEIASLIETYKWIRQDNIVLEEGEYEDGEL